MENFVEYTLPYKLTAVDQAKRAAYVGLPMVAGVFFIMYLGLIGVLLCAGLCYLSYRLYLSFLYELEYTLLEDEIRFSKIINKERRKELSKISIAKTESYGPIENMPRVSCKVISYLSNQGEEPCYYWLCADEKGERVCILFQPDERILKVFEVRARGKMR